MSTFLNYTFNSDTDGTLLENAVAETGGSWVKHPASGGTASISGGQVAYTTASVPAIYYNTATYASGTVSISGVVGSNASPDGLYMGLRFNTTAATFYLGGLDSTSTGLSIYRCNGGTYTKVANATLTAATGDTLTLTQSGTSSVTLTLTRNSTTVLTYTDNSPLPETNIAGTYMAATGAGSPSTLNSITGTDGGSVSSAITIGTLVTSSSGSAITLSLSASVSGGSGTGYSYAIHRSTSSNFTAGSGTLLNNTSTMPYVDSTATGSTVYYYRVIGTDSASSSATATIGNVPSVSGGPYATPGQLTVATPTFAANRSLSPINLVQIGDSITYGATLSSPATQSTGAQMAAALTAQGVTVQYADRGISGYSTTEWQPGTSTYNGAVQASNISSAASTLHAANPSYRMAFSIMLGTNDSAIAGYGNGNKTKAQYTTALKAIVDQIITVDWPNAVVLLHYPIYFTPNAQTSYTYGEGSLALIQQYQQAISTMVANYATTNPGQVFVGDTFGYGYFAMNFATNLTGESGSNGTFFLHPNATGATVLGSLWSKVVYNQLALSGIGPGLNATTLTVNGGGSPIQNFECWITADPAGLVSITGIQTTNANGQVTFNLTTGATYYLRGHGGGFQIGGTTGTPAVLFVA